MMPLIYHKACCCRIVWQAGHHCASCQGLARQILAKQLRKRTAVRFAAPSTARPSKVFRLVPVFRSSKALGKNKALALTRTNQFLRAILDTGTFHKGCAIVSRNWEQIPNFWVEEGSRRSLGWPAHTKRSSGSGFPARHANNSCQTMHWYVPELLSWSFRWSKPVRGCFIGNAHSLVDLAPKPGFSLDHPPPSKQIDEARTLLPSGWTGWVGCIVCGFKERKYHVRPADCWSVGNHCQGQSCRERVCQGQIWCEKFHGRWPHNPKNSHWSFGSPKTVCPKAWDTRKIHCQKAKVFCAQTPERKDVNFFGLTEKPENFVQIRSRCQRHVFFLTLAQEIPMALVSLAVHSFQVADSP